MPLNSDIPLNNTKAPREIQTSAVRPDAEVPLAPPGVQILTVAGQRN